MKLEALRDRIQTSINSTSAENGSNTPDFILAEFLTDCLAAFDKCSRAREKWYGRELRIGMSESACPSMAERDAALACGDDLEPTSRPIRGEIPRARAANSTKVNPVDEPRYPCARCGKLRTKAEGGEVWTTCEGFGHNCDGTPEPPNCQSANVVPAIATVKMSRLEALRRWEPLDDDSDYAMETRECGSWVIFHEAIEAARQDAADLVAAAREQDQARIAELRHELEGHANQEASWKELLAERNGRIEQDRKRIAELEAMNASQARHIAHLEATEAREIELQCAPLEAEVARLKAGVEVEALTEEECNNIVDEWASAPFPDGDYKSNVQRENAGYRQLAEMAATAQRAKVRPRVELTEGEMNAVLDRWQHNYDRKPGETSTHQLMRQIEEARQSAAQLTAKHPKETQP